MTEFPMADSQSGAADMERRRRDAALDETIEQSFPASDSPSTDPNPDNHREPGSDDLMNVQHWKQRLLDLEKPIVERSGRAMAESRGALIDSAHDAGDASLADVEVSERVTETERDSAMLKQIRDALARVDAGTFGRCIVDGGAIEEQRLDAVPWTPYCVKHARLLDSELAPRMPTL